LEREVKGLSCANLKPRTGNVDKKGTAKEDCGLVDVVMLVAIPPAISTRETKRIDRDDSPQGTNAAGLKQKARPAVEGLGGPALCKSPEDVAVGYNQDVAGAIGTSSFGIIYHGCLPLVPYLLDEPVKPLGDVGWASVKGVRLNMRVVIASERSKRRGWLTLLLDSHLSRCPS
jgi:hypothetical protein